LNSQEHIDEHWMARALDLARQGIGLASPNPAVGCVIVKDEQAIGEGFHQYDHRDHAEIVALRQAGESARGTTAYVTLEPCSHHGRTGPCADALIAAGVSRVVVATPDANPQVNGRGIARLRNAGIEVTVGTCQEPAQRLNDAFAKYIRTGLPYMTLKAAMTLDGRIAPATQKKGDIAWITGPESRQQVQTLRHEVDAVLTGIGTVLADDPLLTDRSELPRRRPLLRVVLDSQLSLPLDSKLVRSANGDVLVLCADHPTNLIQDRLQAMLDSGVAVKQIPSDASTTNLSVAAALKELGEMRITSLMVEAGPRVNSALLRASLVDRLFLFYAPWFLGQDGVPLLAHAPLDRPAIHSQTLHHFGPDFAIEARLTNPWRDETRLDFPVPGT
jgi:diaminohydroxyphosphoribosylaminopyrimidine deaminase/5-amino-6-(5-phosphoribosylamino)uracil reductase